MPGRKGRNPGGEAGLRPTFGSSRPILPCSREVMWTPLSTRMGVSSTAAVVRRYSCLNVPVTVGSTAWALDLQPPPSPSKKVDPLLTRLDAPWSCNSIQSGARTAAAIGGLPLYQTPALNAGGRSGSARRPFPPCSRAWSSPRRFSQSFGLPWSSLDTLTDIASQGSETHPR
jgi:hypothetical protein